MTIELFSITVQGHTILATDVHSHPVVCETLYSVCVGGGGTERERERKRERGGGGREREREGGREHASLECTLYSHNKCSIHLCGMKVENPKQSSSFEDDKLVSVMLSADVAGALGHDS